MGCLVRGLVRDFGLGWWGGWLERTRKTGTRPPKRGRARRAAAAVGASPSTFQSPKGLQSCESGRGVASADLVEGSRRQLFDIPLTPAGPPARFPVGDCGDSRLVTDRGCAANSIRATAGIRGVGSGMFDVRFPESLTD